MIMKETLLIHSVTFSQKGALFPKNGTYCPPLYSIKTILPDQVENAKEKFRIFEILECKGIPELDFRDRHHQFIAR